MTSRYKIRVPHPEVIPLRRAESGIKILRSVYNSSGQLIVKEGQTLTDRLRARLKQFGVGRIVVEKPREIWVSESGLSQYDNPDVLDTKQVQDLRVESLDRLEDTNTSDELYERIQFLDHLLRKHNDEASTALQNPLRRLIDLLQQEEATEKELSEFSDQLDISELMEFLRSGEVKEAPEPTPSLPEYLYKDIISISRNRAEVFQDVIDTVLKEALPESLDQFNASFDRTGFNDSEEYNFEQTLKEDGFIAYTDLVAQFLADQYPDQYSTNSQLRKSREKLQRENVSRKTLKQEVYTKVHDSALQSYFLDLLDGLMEPSSSPPEESHEEYQHQKALHKDIQSFRQAQQVTREEFQFTLEKINRRTEEEIVAEKFDLKEKIEPELDSTQTAIQETILQEEEIEDVLDEVEDIEEPKKEMNETPGCEPFKLFKTLAEELELPESLKRQYIFLEEEQSKIVERAESLQETLDDYDLSDSQHQNISAMLEGDIPPHPADLEETELPDELNQRIVNWMDEHKSILRSYHHFFKEISQADNRTDPDDELSKMELRLNQSLENIDTAQLYFQSKNSPDSSKHQEKLIDELIQTKHLTWLSRYTIFTPSIVKWAFSFYTRPENGTERKAELISLGEAVIHDTLFHGRIRKNHLDKFITEIESFLQKKSRPLQNIIYPSHRERFGMVHGLNVSVLTVYLAYEGNYSDSVKRTLAYTGLVMDSGLIVSSPHKLGYQLPELQESVTEEIQIHPVTSKKLIERTDGTPQDSNTVAVQHHERHSSNGYPRGLTKDEQHELSQLIQVIDVYTTLLEGRPHFEPFSPPQALRFLLKHRVNFSTSAVKQLAQSFGLYPNGTLLLLDDARLSLVREQTPGGIASPVVSIITDPEGRKLEKPETKPLSQTRASVQKVMKW